MKPWPVGSGAPDAMRARWPADVPARLDANAGNAGSATWRSLSSRDRESETSRHARCEEPRGRRFQRLWFIVGGGTLTRD